MRTKTLPAIVKTLGDGEPDGTFEALVATYDVDSVNDQIEPGAFTKSLAAWAESGNPIPVIWSHQHDDPFAHVGSVVQAEERDGEGLWIKAALDLDNPTAKQVHKLLKGRRVRNFSFAYDIEDAAPDGDVQKLRQLKLYEVGPTLIGANEDTRALSVKGKKALAVGSGPTSTVDKAWDGAANEARLSNESGAASYRQAYAWVDAEGDPDVKSSYKFIHHEVGTDGTVGAANVRGCIAGVAVLNGGRGGTTIPAADRQGVYNHLAAHIRAADMEPPTLKTIEEAAAVAGGAKALDVVEYLGLKTGRTISAKNEADLREARSLIDRVLHSIGGDSPAESDQGKASARGPVKTEATDAMHGGKAEDPSANTSVDYLAAVLAIAQRKEE